MRKFSEVRQDCIKNEGKTILPCRATKKSAGYDFFSKQAVCVEPNKIAKIWTDVKAEMEDDEVLILDVRSSMGGIWQMANTIGVIDADYANNPKNDGNIGIFLKNISDEKQTIHVGDRIAQGIFLKYLTVDNDEVDEERTGGHGSTGK